MAISITPPLPTPTGVGATAVAGGTLLASTTYYIVVCASNSNLTYNTTNTSITSDASTEISVATTGVNRSITVTWSAVAGATHYNVYMSTTSGNYSSNVCHCTASNGTATTTLLTWTQTAPPSNYYSPDTLVSGNALPFNIDKTKGNVQVVISGTGGTLTLADITSALNTAGLGSYMYYDPKYYNFCLKGGITISAATTGSLIIPDCNIVFIKGAFLNSSTSFTLQLGNYTPASKRWYDPCTYTPTLIATSVANMAMYGAKVCDFGFLTSYTHIGTEITGMNANVVDCVFDGLRNTSTDWSNNKIANFSLLRGWQNFETTNAYFEIPATITMYAPNGRPDYRDCTFKGDSATAIFDMAGNASVSYDSSKFYDCEFVGEYYNSIDDLIFTFSSYVGLDGYDFFYSLQGVVQDNTGTPINGVDVKVYDKDMNLVHNVTTASDIIPKTDIRVMNILPTGNGTGPSYYTRTYYSPFTFVYSKQGYRTVTSVVSLTAPLNSIITLDPVYISLSNLVAGSTVQIYDVTTTTELYNGVVAGTSLDLAYTDAFNDSIRIRVRKMGYTPYEYTGPITDTGIALALSQEVDAVYTANAVDGSTVTEFAFGTNIIEINDPTNTTTGQRLYNWYNYAISTTTYIGDHDNLILAQTSWSYIIDDALLLKNIDAGSATLFIEGANINNTTGDGSVVDTTGGSININGYFPFNSANEVASAVWEDTTTYGTGTKGKKLTDGTVVSDLDPLM